MNQLPQTSPARSALHEQMLTQAMTEVLGCVVYEGINTSGAQATLCDCCRRYWYGDEPEHAPDCAVLVLQTQVAALLEVHAQALQRQPRWIPVEEALPEEGKWVQVALTQVTDLGRYRFVNVAYQADGEWHGLSDGERVTHWQDLPNLPDDAAVTPQEPSAVARIGDNVVLDGAVPLADTQPQAAFSVLTQLVTPSVDKETDLNKLGATDLAAIVQRQIDDQKKVIDRFFRVIEVTDAALNHIESLSRRKSLYASEIAAEGGVHTTAYEEAIEAAEVLKHPSEIAREAIDKAARILEGQG